MRMLPAHLRARVHPDLRCVAQDKAEGTAEDKERAADKFAEINHGATSHFANVARAWWQHRFAQLPSGSARQALSATTSLQVTALHLHSSLGDDTVASHCCRRP